MALGLPDIMALFTIEMHIIIMVKEWVRDCRVATVSSILYSDEVAHLAMSRIVSCTFP
jgi:hypothetical protein